MPGWLETVFADFEKTGDIQRKKRFEGLPDLTLPPPPDFSQGFTPQYGVFTDFQGTGGIDPAITDLLKNRALRDRITGIVPSRADYERAETAKWDQIMSQMGLNREQLAANLSARGMGGAGEVSRYLVRDIQAPAAEAMATVSAEAGLAFSRDVTAATIAQEQLLAGSRGQWLDAGKTNAQLASTEQMFGADMESRERMEANRNDLTKGMHDDNITLEVYRSQLDAQLREYLSKMTWLTATDVANIQGRWAVEAAKARNKKDAWDKFGLIVNWATKLYGAFGGGGGGG